MNKYFYHAVLIIDGEDKESYGIVQAIDAMEAHRYITNKLSSMADNPNSYQLRAFNNVK